MYLFINIYPTIYMRSRCPITILKCLGVSKFNTPISPSIIIDPYPLLCRWVKNWLSRFLFESSDASKDTWLEAQKNCSLPILSIFSFWNIFMATRIRRHRSLLASIFDLDHVQNYMLYYYSNCACTTLLLLGVIWNSYCTRCANKNGNGNGAVCSSACKQKAGRKDATKDD